MGKHLLLLAVSVALIMGCGGSDNPSDNPVADGVVLPDGFEARVFADGFDGPTQMVFAPNGDLILAELNGGENDATGRIIRIARDDLSERTVLQSGLDKPTGIAVAGNRLWIMERRRLSVTSLDPDAMLVVVADEMPFNGRSQGTLTVTPDGRLLYDTSGSKRGPDRVEGSGTLFSIENAAGGANEPVVVATGFKHAYAHLVDADGQLWSIEMTDGNFDEQRAPDELVALQPGDDAGWPQCVGDNRPVIEFGGSDGLCAQSPASHAVFGVGTTPTSFVVSPWDPNTFIAALWLPGKVVTVPRSAPIDGPYEPTTFVDGIDSPQHLLVDGDQLLVSDHETGQIFVISQVS